MAYQSGRYSASNDGANLNKLAKSLQTFGGVMNDREQIKQKQREIEVAELEEREIQQAKEIFEGELGGDIKNEHTFATKVGNKKYQELKSNDMLNKNYQKSLEEGAEKGLSAEEMRLSFRKLNDEVMVANDLNEDFKNNYVNKSIEFESHFDEAANKEKVSNLNKEFKIENTENFVSGMKTYKKDEDIIEHINIVKSKTGDNYDDYIVEAVNVMTAQGRKIPENYYEEFSKRSDGNLEVAQALSRNTVKTTRQEKQTNAFLKETYEVSKTENHPLKEVDKNWKEYSNTLTGNDYENSVIDFNYYKAHLGEVNEASVALVNGDVDLYNEIIKSNDLLSSKGYDIKKITEEKVMSSIDLSNIDSFGISMINNLKSINGEMPKQVVDYVTNALTNPSKASLDEANDIMHNFGNDALLYEKLTTDQKGLMLFYQRSIESGTDNLVITDAINGYSERVANNTFDNNTPKEKMEMKGEIKSIIKKVAGLNEDEYNSANLNNSNIFDQYVSDAYFLASSTGVSVEDAISTMFTEDFVAKTFIDAGTGSWFGERKLVKQGANNNNGQTNSALIRDHLETFVKGKLLNDLGNVSDLYSNISPDIVRALKNGDGIDDMISFRSTERTEKDGTLEVIMTDEHGIDRPIRNRDTGENLLFATSMFGALKEDNDKMQSGGDNSNLTLDPKMVVDIWDNSLEKIEMDAIDAKADKGEKSRSVATSTGYKQYGEGWILKNTTPKNRYTPSKNTQKFVRDAAKKEEKIKKRDINSEYTEEEVKTFNRNIQSKISKGKKELKDLSYPVRMATEELDTQGLVTKDNMLELLKGEVDTLNEVYVKFGKSEKVRQEIQKEMKTENQKKFGKYKGNKYNNPYDEGVVNVNTDLISKIGVPNNAKSMDRLAQLTDLVLHIESSNGTNIINKHSSATGPYQYMVANGKWNEKNSNYEGSSLQTAINRVKSTFGSLPKELQDIDNIGKTLKGVSEKDPEYVAFRNKFANLPFDVHHTLFIGDLYQKKGTSKVLQSVLTGTEDEAKDAIATIYTKYHNTDLNQVSNDKIVKMLNSGKLFAFR